MKENIAVIFGGKSVEHDISIITGMQVLKNLPKKYNALPIYVDENGEFCIADNLDDVKTFLNFDKRVKKRKRVTFLIGSPYILIEGRGKYAKRIKISCGILCNHGKNGEDGSLQGVMQLCNIPYTSPSVASSAVCMDKVLTKHILKALKIKTPDFVYFYSHEYQSNKQKVLDKINAALPYPIVVKPCSLGSSVGITVCEKAEEVEAAIENALLFDEKIIVEKYVENAAEFNCAVVKLNNTPLPSDVGVVEKDKIFSFKNKYLSKKAPKNSNLEENLKHKIQKLAVKAYDGLGCDGVVRVDFLYDGTLYVNEVNTIPGSLAFNLFHTPFKDLLDSIILEAKTRAKEGERQVYHFSSDAIELFSKIQNENEYTKL